MSDLTDKDKEIMKNADQAMRMMLQDFKELVSAWRKLHIKEFGYNLDCMLDNFFANYLRNFVQDPHKWIKDIETILNKGIETDAILNS